MAGECDDAMDAGRRHGDASTREGTCDGRVTHGRRRASRAGGERVVGDAENHRVLARGRGVRAVRIGRVDGERDEAIGDRR